MGLKQRKTLKEAIEAIKDGDAIVLGGWTIFRTPMAAAYEIIRQGKKDLYLSASATGTISDMLIGAGCVKICEAAWHGHEAYGFSYNVKRVIEEGKTNFRHLEETTTSVFMRAYAAAMGLPFIPTLALKGSDMLNPEYDTLKDLRGKDPKIAKKRYLEIDDPFWEGNKVILIPAARPDVAIIHVQEVGEEGTIRINGPQFGDIWYAAAAKYTIVTTEKIVSEEFLKENTNLNSIPGEFVDAIVEVPFGSHPGGCYGYHDTDPWFYKDYVEASKKEQTFRQWLDKWVFDLPDHAAYLNKIGKEQIKAITADPAYGYNPNLKRSI